jgi:hypothetical protein
MRPPANSAWLWLPGPLFGVSLIALAVIGNSGPGFFFFSIAAAVGFVVLTPLIQFVLYRTPQFRARRRAACIVAIAVVTVGLLTVSGAPIFNQW